MQVTDADKMVACGPLGVDVTDAVAVASRVGVSVGGSDVGEEGKEVGVPSEFTDVACAGGFTGAPVLVAEVDGPHAEIKMDAVVSQNNKRTFMIAP